MAPPVWAHLLLLESTLERRHDLDWVRVCAFALLVLYHVGMYYVTWDWHIKTPAPSSALEPFMLMSSPWRLSLLFLVSGAATGFLLVKGRERFLRQRSWRLLVPVVFGMFVTVVPQTYYQVVELGFKDGWIAFYKLYLSGSLCRGDECLETPTWNHLWFVAYLWVYTVVLCALLAIAPRAVDRFRETLARQLEGIGLLLWPLLLLAGARLALVGWFEQTHGLVDDWYNHAQYLPLFLLGFLVARADAVWNAAARLRWAALGLALASWAFIAWYFCSYAVDFEPPTWIRMFQRCIWALQQWSAIVAVLGFARQLAPKDSPRLRYLADAVFPVYILHQTLIITFAHHLKPFAIAPIVEAPLLVLLTFAGSFAGYELVKRVRLLRPLFGLKNATRSR
jgi:glucans biosynthesis protein C